MQERCRRLGIGCTLATRIGSPDEMLIVKTNLNYGGEIEQRLSATERELLGIDAPASVITKASDYPVLARRDVPVDWWSDQSLVVEKFITNHEHRWYRVFFLLSHVVISEMTNPSEIKKVGGSKMTRHWCVTMNADGTVAGVTADGPHEMLRDVDRLRRDAALDFGAIDVVAADDGGAYIIDVNTTPAYYFPVPGLVEHLQQALPGINGS
jgi:hypothetical protein